MYIFKFIFNVAGAMTIVESCYIANEISRFCNTRNGLIKDDI